jgi:hypothetical protein
MAVGDRPNYLKAAFANVYNLSLLSGAVLASVMTGDYIIAAAAVGLEAIWLIVGPDLRPFQRSVNDAQREEREKADRERVAKLMESLPEREWQRAHALDELKREIERDMQTNPSFQAILLQSELDKMSQLHQSFVQLASACTRAESYLMAVDIKDLQRQMQTQKGVEEKMTDPAVREIARKNQIVIEKRLETIQDIQKFLARARGQMNLIENTVRLLRDQVLTMTSPDQLGEQLDDLLTGVSAIQQSAKDNELFSSAIAMDPIGPIGDQAATSNPSEKIRS